MKRTNHIPPGLQELVDEARRLEAGGSAPKTHHYVPESYLARWAEGGQLRVTDVGERRDFRTSPNRAAKKTDFYRIESEDLDPATIPPLLFEVLLGKMERWGKAAIDDLVRPEGRLSTEATVQFAWFLAMQATRGVGFREEIRWAANAVVQQHYKDLSDEGIAAMLQDRGQDVTDATIAAAREGIDALMAGTIFVAPQDAAAVGHAAEMAGQVTEHFLDRAWVVFSTPNVLITSDEPVVAIGGPGFPRDERAGLAMAGVVVFPLSPSHLLAMFRADITVGLPVRWRSNGHAIGELDHLETTELNREIAMAAHRWTFERPSKRAVARMAIPPRPASGSVEESTPEMDGDIARSLIRFYKRTRWAAVPDAPWPVSSWWS